MRKAVIAVLLALVAFNGAFVVADALAQSQGGGRGGGGGGNGGSGKTKVRPPPPPPARCPDLALATYAIVPTIPGAAPLAENEIAVQWNVHNAGTATYDAAGADQQSLSLEYSAPSGVHQIATIFVPAAPAPAATATPASTSAAPPAATPPAGPVSLAQGQSWRGYMRAVVPAEAQHRMLRLKLNYTGDWRYASPNDCDTGNNEIELRR